MAKVAIKAGAEIETTTPAETREIIHWSVQQAEDARERERARGVKIIRVSGPGPAAAASTYYLKDASPESGLCWSVRLLSVQLASAGTLLAYITSSAPLTGATPQRLLWNFSTSGTNQSATFPTASAMLYGDEGIYLSATQNISAFFVSAWQVPAEMEYKLL